MGAVYSVLIILTCIVLILAILVQNPKGGGLASGFTTGSQVMGVRRTADFLEKATWVLVGFLFVLSVATTAYTGNGKTTTTTETSSTKDKADQFNKTGAGAKQQQNGFMNQQQGPPAGGKPGAMNPTPGNPAPPLGTPAK